MKTTKILLTLICLSITAYSNNTEKKESISGLKIPEGIEMRFYNEEGPNYLAGSCSVIINKTPKSKMDTLTYLIIENRYRGALKANYEKTKVLPAVVFEKVSEEDAKRMIKNLIHLGCEAEYKLIEEK